MKVKVEELEGSALDWAVAHAVLSERDLYLYTLNFAKDGKYGSLKAFKKYTPSTNWEQGGPLIEKFMETNTHISVCRVDDRYVFSDDDGIYNGTRVEFMESGSSFLIAAMRAIVADKLGNVIDIPDELT